MRDDSKCDNQWSWEEFLSHEVMHPDNPGYPSVGRTAFYRAQFSSLNEICWVSGSLWIMGDITKGTSGTKELKYKEIWWYLDPSSISEMFSLRKKKYRKTWKQIKALIKYKWYVVRGQEVQQQEIGQCFKGQIQSVMIFIYFFTMTFWTGDSR